jgi:hypothetical protein
MLRTMPSQRTPDAEAVEEDRMQYNGSRATTKEELDATYVSEQWNE